MLELTANDLVQSVYCFIAGLSSVVGLLYLYRCLVARVRHEVGGDPYVLTFAIGLGWSFSGAAHARLFYLRMLVEQAAATTVSSFASEMIAIGAGVGMSVACIAHLWIAVKRRFSPGLMVYVISAWLVTSLIVGAMP